MRRWVLVLALVGLGPGFGCSIKRLAVNKVADALVAGGSVYASDEDPELVRDAVPFALKTMESLLAEVPENEDLLLAACSGFTQYAYAFVDTDALVVEPEDWLAADALWTRAQALYRRGRDYCLRALELRHPGATAGLEIEPATALAGAEPRDVPLLFWTAASWGAAISVGKDRPELVADLPAVIALARRALELDEAYERGAIHEVLIVLESLPANMGGSLDRARGHFERALELSDGRRASVYTTMAIKVAVARQDREQFVELLERALAVDPLAEPAWRVANFVARRQAEAWLVRADDLFFEEQP